MRLSVQLFAARPGPATNEEALRGVVSMAREAEALGFQTAWFAEHHRTLWNVCPDPLTLAAHVAALTDRIGLGTAVVNLTLHDALSVAERADLVSVLSGGRLHLGIGRGFAASDYLAFGIDPSEAGEVFTLRHARLREIISDGRHGTAPRWLATTGSDSALAMAARHGYGLLLASPAGKIRDIARRSAAAWSAAGRREQQPVAVFRAVHIADSAGKAREELAPHVEWYIRQAAALQPDQRGPDLDEVLGTFCVFGSPADCIAQLRILEAQMRLTELVCVFGLGSAPEPLALSAMQRFAAEVAPALSTGPIPDRTHRQENR